MICTDWLVLQLTRAEQLTLLSFYMVSRKSAFGKCLENRLAANVDFKALSTKSESVSYSEDGSWKLATIVVHSSLITRYLFPASCSSML